MGYSGTPEEARAKRAEYHKRWYEKNKAKVLADNREWLRANPDKKKAQSERYKKRNPEKAKAVRRAAALKHYYKDVEKSRAYQREAARRRAQRIPDFHREKRLWEHFRMTPQQWEAMFEAQGRRCAMCRTDSPGSRQGMGWHTDHCHATGKVRYILCSHCNRGLGAFKDDPALMRRAADMLEAWQMEQAVAA